VTLTAEAVVPAVNGAVRSQRDGGSGGALWVKVTLGVVLAGALALLVGAALRPR
jgi:hypothetical protein